MLYLIRYKIDNDKIIIFLKYLEAELTAAFKDVKLYIRDLS